MAGRALRLEHGLAGRRRRRRRWSAAADATSRSRSRRTSAGTPRGRRSDRWSAGTSACRDRGGRPARPVRSTRRSCRRGRWPSAADLDRWLRRGYRRRGRTRNWCCRCCGRARSPLDRRARAPDTRRCRRRRSGPGRRPAAAARSPPATMTEERSAQSAVCNAFHLRRSSYGVASHGRNTADHI